MTETRSDGCRQVSVRRFSGVGVAVLAWAASWALTGCGAEMQAAERLYLGKRGPETVAIVSVLPGEATEVVRELCRSEFGSTSVQVIHKNYAVALTDVRAGRPAGHLLLGATAPDCRELAEGGWLVPSAAAIAPALEQRLRGAGDRFVVPMLRPIVIAARRDGDVPAPGKLEALVYDRAYGQQLALVEPDGAPELWFGLLRHILRSGRPSEYAFAWLRTLDHQEPAYVESFDGARERLLAGDSGVALLPEDMVDDVAPRFVHAEPGEGLPAVTAAIARLTATSAPAATERVFQYLCSTEFVTGMTAAKLLPLPRPDLRSRDLSVAQRRRMQAAWRYEYDAEQAEEWIAEWRSTVLGSGSRIAWWDRVLQIGMFAAFAVVLFVLYRKMGKQEAAEQEVGSEERP